jgi:hypothetical protein
MHEGTRLYAGFELYTIQGVARSLRGKVFTGYHSNGIAEFTAGDKLYDATPIEASYLHLTDFAIAHYGVTS